MLARIPFWGWFCIIVATLYAVYNPTGLSAVHMWASGSTMDYLPFKMLFTLFLVTVLGLVVHGTIKSLSWFGTAAMLSIIAVVIWCAHAVVKFDLFSAAFWSWAAQPLVGAILTVGWQWPKIWRRSTGNVSVTETE